jgi:CHAT domain-containing protein/tetratricopeptide (TPR) repeat protein
LPDRDARKSRGPGLAACIIAAALLLLGAESFVRSAGDTAPRPASSPAAPPSAAWRLAQKRAAEDRVAAAEAAHGGVSAQVAAALADEAFLLWSLEEYSAGLPIAERALAIRLTAPLETREQAGSRYQVADFRRATGDYAGALEEYRGAIATWGRLLGEDHVEIASAWHYMGVVLGLAGDPEGARACLLRALDLRERGLGESDPLVASTLQALADLAMRSGDPAAEGLLVRAQRIWERSLGPRDPFVARSLLARVRLRAAAGDLASARPLLERALEIRLAAFGPGHHLVGQARRAMADLLARAGDAGAALAEAEAAVGILKGALGPAHPEVASALADLGRLQWWAGHSTDALVSALAAERMAREQFLRSSRDLDEALALRYASARTSGLDVMLTALAERPADLEPGAAAREGVDALIRSRGMVLDAPSRPPRDHDPGSARIDRRDEGSVDPGLDEVRQAIPAGGALVAYARYERPGGPGGDPQPSYLAVVLRPESEVPEVVALGPAAAIDAAVVAWRREVTRDPHDRNALGPGEQGAEQAARAAGERLRRAVWDPVTSAVGSASQVFLVPDGILALVGFGALPAGRDRYLVESGPLFHELTAERDLISKTGGAVRGAGLLALGGPDFEGDPGGAASSGAGGSSRPPARPLCPEFARLTFEPLPGAAVEAREVAALVPPDGGRIVLEGREAGALAFALHATGKRLLHLATHAFVLPERCALTPPDGAAADLAAIPVERVLLRSGLALAGANRRGAEDDAEDGVITAEQIAALDLSGVEWVVLSACDTGLGEIHAGEGVVGLRHAFERAGARTVIMSLWGADDGAARAFMRALYAARSAGATTPEAMRAAALELLRFQRAHGRTTHPYYWGGFVAAGDWR